MFLSKKTVIVQHSCDEDTSKQQQIITKVKKVFQHINIGEISFETEKEFLSAANVISEA